MSERTIKAADVKVGDRIMVAADGAHEAGIVAVVRPARAISHIENGIEFRVDLADDAYINSAHAPGDDIVLAD